ncbi:MAG: Gldg family protein [Lachnospiraceae bacterium]|nr:Gldg family protein [Lachnospiraceae bacterium]
MFAVFKREFKSFFQNVIGWVFLAGMIFMSSFYFRAYNLVGGFPDILRVLVSLLIIMVFAIPVLSMRILTDERKNKIDQLTLTSPVSIGEIVVGKYLAMASILGITTLSIGAFLLLIAKYADIDWAINLLSMLGFFLYGCACIAVCLFISSFTESQVIAAILNIITMFVIYILAGIMDLLNNSENQILQLVAKVLSIMDFSTRFDCFLSGILDIKAIVYFISVIVVFIFLTTQSIQKRRYTVSVKNFSFGAFSVSMIVMVIALAILANLGIKRISKDYTEFDLTKTKLYSLTDATKDLLDEYQEDITIYVYASSENKDEAVDRILNNYASYDKHISIVYKDPDKSPKFYEKYTKDTPTYNSLFLETKDRSKYIDYEGLYITDYSYADDYTPTTTVSYDIEGKVTSGINYLRTGLTAKVYNLTGHDEMQFEKGYLDALEKNNVTIEDISLVGKEIPDDCQMLIINAPNSDLSKDDAKKVTDYLDNGGNVLLTLGVVDDLDTNMPNFNTILKYYNIEVLNGLIVDMQQYYQLPYYIIGATNNNIVTKGVHEKKPVLLPYAKALFFNDDDENVNITTFLMSTETSFNKMNVTSVDDFNYSDGDPTGPFNIGIVAKKGGYQDATGASYIIASPNVFSDVADEITSNAGSTMFMNIVNNCVDQDAMNAVIVPVRSMDAEPFMISSSAGLIIFIILMVVVPITLLATGFIIWQKRRRK